MMGMLPIAQYLGFHDVPLVIFVRYHEQLYLLDCDFVDDLDDYSDEYQVWALNEETYSRFNQRELELGELIADGRRVGTVARKDVKFDETRRLSIDDGIFASLGV
jgi:hypothetical protein